jgi:hypothetical protein
MSLGSQRAERGQPLPVVARDLAVFSLIPLILNCGLGPLSVRLRTSTKRWVRPRC